MVFALWSTEREALGSPEARGLLERFRRSVGKKRAGRACLAKRLESGTLGFPDCDSLGLRLAVILFASVNDSGFANDGSSTKSGH